MKIFALNHTTDPAQAVATASKAKTAQQGAEIRFIGGGTTLIDLMKLDVMRPEVLIDITGLRDEAMHRIEHSAGELRIG